MCAMLLGACRIAARRALPATRRTSHIYGTSSTLRSLSTTSKKFNANSPSSHGGEISSAIPDIGTESLDLSRIAEALSSDLIIAAGGTPTLDDLGLGGWTPWGLLQRGLYELHSIGLPWWASITVSTVALRLLLFPLVVRSQHYHVSLHNNTPQITELKRRIDESRQTGNELELERAQEDFLKLCNEKKINPFNGMAALIVQAPIFVSYFIAIREMTHLPLDTMKTGGFSWVTDLTVPDPYYILPVLTSLSLFGAIQLASRNNAQVQQLGILRYGVLVLPLLIFPFAINFTSGIVWYWTTSNSFALCQVALLNVPSIRAWLKIPKFVRHKSPKSHKPVW